MIYSHVKFKLVLLVMHSNSLQGKGSYLRCATFILFPQRLAAVEGER